MFAVWYCSTVIVKHYGHSVSQSVLSKKYSQLEHLQPEVSPSSLLVAFLTWPSCPNSYLPVYLPQLATHSFPLFIFVALQSGQPGLYTETAVHRNLHLISTDRPSHSIYALDQHALLSKYRGRQGHQHQSTPYWPTAYKWHALAEICWERWSWEISY